MHAHVLNLVASAFLLVSCAGSAMAQDQMIPAPLNQEQIQSPSTSQDERTIGQGSMMRESAGERAGSEMTKGGMMGRDMMPGGATVSRSPIMLRMMFALIDSDGDGSISLQEFQAAHERIFKAMDANKDGQITEDEMLAFMQGVRRSAPQQ